MINLDNYFGLVIVGDDVQLIEFLIVNNVSSICRMMKKIRNVMWCLAWYKGITNWE
jgi:hypothetical protein